MKRKLVTRVIKRLLLFVLVGLAIGIIILAFLLFRNRPGDLCIEAGQKDYTSFNLKETFDALYDKEYASYKQQLDSQFNQRISEYTLDELLDDVGYFKDTPYYQQVVDSIEVRALEEGALSISKVYKAAIDSCWDVVVDYEIYDVIDDIPIEEHKELLPYYIDTEYQNRIFSAYYNRIEQYLSDIRCEMIDSILNDVNRSFDETLDKDIAAIYDEFLGGTLGWNNFKNNIFQTKEATNKKFLAIWKRQMASGRYSEKYNDYVRKWLSVYKKKRQTYLSQIGESADVPNIATDLEIAPNMEVMRNAVHNKTNRTYLSTAVDVVTLPLGGWGAIAALAGATALDYGLDCTDTFKDPEQDFINNEYKHVSNLLTEHLYKIDKLLQDKDSLTMISIKDKCE